MCLTVRYIQCVLYLELHSDHTYVSLVPRPHPPGEEKGLVTIRHPARPSDVAVWHMK